MEQRKRIIWLDYLKGIVILLVIIGHCALPPNLRKFIYSFHMPLFFFAGGLTLKMTSELSAKEFVKKKINALLIPYIALNLCTIATWTFFGRYLTGSQDTIFTVLKGILYANNDAIVLVCGPSWFLPTLFLTEVAVFFIYRYIFEKPEMLLTISFGFALLGYMVSLQERQTRLWHMNSVPVGMLFVTAGLFFAMKYKENGYQALMQKVSWKWIAILFFIGFLAQRYNGKVSFGGNNYKQMDLTLLAAFSLILATVFLCMKLPQNEKNGIFRWLLFTGKTSLLFLGIHKTILFALKWKWPQMREPSLASGAGAIIVIAGTTIVSYIIDRWFPFWIGKKGKTVNQIGAVIWIVLTIGMYVRFCM